MNAVHASHGVELECSPSRRRTKEEKQPHFFHRTPDQISAEDCAILCKQRPPNPAPAAPPCRRVSLSDDLTFTYYAVGLHGGLYGRPQVMIRMVLSSHPQLLLADVFLCLTILPSLTMRWVCMEGCMGDHTIRYCPRTCSSSLPRCFWKLLRCVSLGERGVKLSLVHPLSHTKFG
jgi:hypothetical protein